MKLEELVAASRSENEKVFGSLNDKRIARITAAVMRKVSKELQSMEAGKTNVGGLGTFVVRDVEVKVKGEKVRRRRITLRPRKN